MNENIYHTKSNTNYSNKLYAVMNTETNRLETKLTNPGRKFWEVKGHCKNALLNYKKTYQDSHNKLKMTNPNVLKIVEFTLVINDFIE